VYHFPGHKEGYSLDGLEGKVLKDVREWQGTEISANLPYLVEFQIDGGEGKIKKFKAHLAPEEIELV